MASAELTLTVILFGALSPIVTAIQQFLPSTDAIDIGLTRDLQIECTFTKDSTIVLTSSLTILFSSVTDQPVFDTIASVGSSGINNLSGAVASGYVSYIGKSKLSLTWTYPTPDRAGIYKCEAKGSTNGVVKIKYLTFEITAAMPSQETFLQYFQQMTKDVEDLKASSEDVILLQSELNDRLNRGKSKFFRSSNGVYQGHRYYLSADSNILVTEDAEAICEIFGGYLVEIDSPEEYKFIVDHLLCNFTLYTYILSGGRDVLVENNWVNAYSRTPVKYISWVPGEPNGGRGENCIYFSRDRGWYMIDAPCYYGLANTIVGYLCEIPE